MTETTATTTGAVSSDAAVVDGINVDAVAAAVRACAGVSDLVGGRFGDVTSYLPGRRVAGVSVNAQVVRVQVRSRWGVPAGDLLSQITTMLTPVVHGRHVEVVVADVDDPSTLQSGPPLALGSGAEPDPAASL